MIRDRETDMYCPVVRAIEVVGEKWSLLIVRDLLFGPRRFTDLQRSVSGISQKWLTARLRDLEAAGIVVREKASDRREVWYRLTAKGRELSRVIEALAGWGFEHGRPRLPGEPIAVAPAMAVTIAMLNRWQIRPNQAATWRVDGVAEQPFAVHFDGERWLPTTDVTTGGVVIASATDQWLKLIAAPVSARADLLDQLRIEGAETSVAQLRAAFAAGAN